MDREGRQGEGAAMYAAIRQFKAKPGSADALAEKIKEAISLISDVSGFMGYYVVYAPDDTVTAISVFNTVAEAQESNPAGARLHRRQSRTIGYRASERDRRTGDRAFAALRRLARACQLARRRINWSGVRPAFGGSPSLRHVEPALNGGPRKPALEPGGDMLHLSEADQLAGVVKTDEIAHPAKH
jgi:hypothetical protein